MGTEIFTFKLFYFLSRMSFTQLRSYFLVLELHTRGRHLQSRQTKSLFDISALRVATCKVARQSRYLTLARCGLRLPESSARGDTYKLASRYAILTLARSGLRLPENSARGDTYKLASRNAILTLARSGLLLSESRYTPRDMSLSELHII